MIKSISKKIIGSIFIIIMFFVIFLLKEYIMNPFLVNAYQISNTNQVGSYPINFNKDNYYDINLYEETTNNIELGRWDTYINNFYFKPNTTYSIKSFDCSTGGTNFFIYYNGESIQQLNYNWTKQCDVTFTTNSDITDSHPYKLRMSGTYDTNNFKFKKVMQVESNELPDKYTKKFMFGYNVYASGTIKNISSNNISGNYYLDFCPLYINVCNNKYKITSETFIITPNNYIELDKSLNKIYIPFNFSNNNISLNNNMIFSTTLNDNQVEFNLKLELVPIFQATPIDNNISDNTIIFNYVYTFNSVSLSGIQLTSYDSTYNEGNYLCLNADKYNKEMCLPNNEKNYITNSYNIDSVNINDRLKSEYFFDEAYKMTININDINSDVNILSIDSYNLLIVGDTSNTTPFINGSNTYEQYNTCSAWYDIPCQLSNGLTYVIYNVPVISPLIQLLKSMVAVITSIVTMIKWYEGLGILFGLFIFILMIRIIIMLLKGSNDDRGGKK